MSMPMICDAACRASSGELASLMPPALPRPPTGTCALTATGPSSRQAAAASSGVRATLPGGMGMPSEARTSLAWYSRSFKSAGRGVTGSRAPSKCIDASERDVAVPPGAATPLFAQCDLQRPDQLPPRTSRLDHVVDVAALCGDEGVGKL